MITNPYSTSTVDDESYKYLVCGRSKEIEELIKYLSKGRSIALYGERRIGKSSLLYLLKDILNGSINSYLADLIDLDLNAYSWPK